MGGGPQDPGATYWPEDEVPRSDYRAPDETDGPEEPPSDAEHTSAPPPIPTRALELNAEYDSWAAMSAPSVIFADDGEP